MAKSPADHAGSAAGEARIYEGLFAAIVDQRLAPGTRLNELELTRVYGCGRRQTEAALARLGFESLVQFVAQRGAFVASPGEPEARAIFAARKVIEAGILATAASRASGADFRRLEQNVADEAAMRQAGRVREAIKLSGAFHLLLAEISGNPILAAQLRQLVARSSLVISLYENQTVMSCWHDDHRVLVRNLREHKVAAAARLMQKHLDELEESLDFRRSRGSKMKLRAILGDGQTSERKA
jgi:DNA-binding GntR family transcriptional regulator